MKIVGAVALNVVLGACGKEAVNSAFVAVSSVESQTADRLNIQNSIPASFQISVGQTVDLDCEATAPPAPTLAGGNVDNDIHFQSDASKGESEGDNPTFKP